LIDQLLAGGFSVADVAFVAASPEPPFRFAAFFGEFGDFDAFVLFADGLVEFIYAAFKATGLTVELEATVLVIGD